MTNTPPTIEQSVAARDAFVRSLSLSDLHAIGKHLLAMDDDRLRTDGFSEREINNSEHLFSRIDLALSTAIGDDWPDREPL